MTISAQVTIIRALGLLVALLPDCTSIPIDNSVVGEPEIECESGRIVVMFNTRNRFVGRVYVKGMSHEDECVGKGGGQIYGGIRLPFNTCNVRRTRSLNPKGIFVSSTIIISFHPRFETKVDRAYLIRCYYMEADKTVSSDLEVSMLTTGAATFNVPMPVCRYEILEGGAGGRVVEYAVVGQQVFHKWTCDTESIDTYCMVVHSCVVEDSEGDQVLLIGPKGCAEDLHLLSHPDYTSDLMAGVEAHIFKFADKAQVYFQCQIAIYVKEQNKECPRPRCGKTNNPTTVTVNRYEAYPLGAGSSYLPRSNRRPPSPPNRFGYRSAIKKGNSTVTEKPKEIQVEDPAESHRVNDFSSQDEDLRDGTRTSRRQHPKPLPLPDEVVLWPSETVFQTLPSAGDPFRNKRRVHEFAGVTDVETQITAVNYDERKGEKDTDNYSLIITERVGRPESGGEEFCLPLRQLINALIGLGLVLSFLSGFAVTFVCGRKCQTNSTVLRLKT